MAQPESLLARLNRKPILVAPGVYDAFTALVAEQAGFTTLYVSGAAIAYTRLGRSDVGLVGMNEVAEVVSLIRDRVGCHLIVDADTGYGNALNVGRTMRLFERAGAAAIQLEDQDFPKVCGHFDEKRLVPAAEMVGKIKAALDARGSRDTLVVARADMRSRSFMLSLMLPFIRSSVRKRQGADFERFKRLLEAGELSA